ncbi:hypothetical protein NK553_13380 [Pseudomonas sp. ZM23]|uniref:Lipoprotein n=1 Tax=Pseudomonas triclosanedens TaxID=2961893 RepID=A0ABY7A3I1_9PSED|nr:hypothetical protein [Pseudomonas triclosanedens]MCP8464940.1 hypothetical protein [Pseudomonas triclosanedens]MCP8470348.1 hypothetical protein [Pseudomonas triclosanedens]MCP8476153.1 hypothetical protein [Pseudomonas triclosanedens]WAI51614.1 hypothetical protein OU419_10305 [Pseudomonas triclosanedens]
MNHLPKTLPVLAAIAMLSGCMSDQEFLASNQQAAINATESRAKFELNCEAVTSSVLSSKVTSVRRAMQRTEYTIGVRGCNRQATYITYCLNPTDCNAIANTARTSTP